MRKQIAATAVLLILVSGTAGCTEGVRDSSPSSQETDQVELASPEELDSISLEQEAALIDGEVSREEYEAGFQRFQSCMDGIGYPLAGVSEVNGVFDYSYPSVADHNGALECYSSEFKLIDRAWQTKPEIMEQSESSRIIRACLIDHGVKPESTHIQRYEQFLELGIDPSECL
jgi:hypothetical protein